MLKLKISRLRIAVIFIAVIFIINLCSNYSISRENLRYDIPHAEETLRKMTRKVYDIKNDQAPIVSSIEDIETLNTQQHTAIIRDLNLVEKNQLKKVANGLHMNFNVDYLYNLLKTRHMNGTFSDRDEKAFTLYKQYIESITQAFQDERLQLNEQGKLQKLLYTIDIKAIAENYAKLNELAFLYTEYDKFPEELPPMTEAALKDRLKAILNLEDADIEFRDYMEKEVRLNGKCTFDIKKGSSLRLKTWASTITIPAIQI